MKSIELITIPAIAKPLPFVLFLLHKISPIIDKIKPIVEVPPQHNIETKDTTKPAIAVPSVF